MFIQVFQGKVTDADLVRRMDERWIAEIKPGAKGYLGYTGGITPDGRYIGLARFESADAAQANSDSPEQTAWWNEAVKGFEGEPTVHDCTEVDTPFGGGSDTAGFVQVIQGRAKDPAKLRSMGNDRQAELRAARPDILGMVIAWHGDGKDFTQAVYFTSEAETRQLEKDSESSEMRQEYDDMFEGQPTFFDLPNPLLD
ncbi:MAG: hypothetical protein JJD92_05515 [Frankiaceae bacterium]|nr:hypothetical protein [Frankiaceae bacterium]